MGATLITGPTFPALEQRLLADLADWTASAALAPQWVVVPSATLANHLRARLARAATAHILANVRVITLPRLAERLALALLDEPTRPWHPALDLTLFDLVAALPDRSPLANLRHISGGALLLRQAFTDLAEGGFGPADCDKLADLAAEPDLADSERAVVRLYADWIQQLTARGVPWSPLTLQKLPGRITDASVDQLAVVLAAEAGQEPRLLVYGFYEWLDVHLQWLTVLAERVPTMFYYPWQGTGPQAHPAFAFTQTVREDLLSRLPSLTAEPALPADQSTAKFFLATFPEGELSSAPPPFLSWQRASGIRAEVISAAVRVRRWLDDPQDPIPPEEIVVVAPQAAAYADTIRDVFRAFAIPLRVSDVSAGPTPSDLPVRILARLWEEQAPAEWVLALLRAAPDTPAAQGIDLNRFEQKLRELKIWGGPAWRHAAEAGSNDAEQQLIDELCAFVPAEDTPPADDLTAAEAGAMLDRLARHWLADHTPLAPLRDALAAVVRPKSFRLARRQWTRLLAECATDKIQRDPLSRSVLFTPLMRARGLTARAVVMLGLASGQMPRRIEEDPVLSEQALGRIAHVAAMIGHRLPLRTRATEEMLLLFHLVNTAAERVHWVVPETDAAGKSVAPTPWVQRYLQRWETPAPADLFTQRMPRSPHLQAQALAALDPQQGRYLPPSIALALDPVIATHGGLPSADTALLGALDRRGKDLQWSGGIGGPPTITRNELAVTKIEVLAKCPYRFYTEKLARWDPLEPLTLSLELEAIGRGNLVHRVLQQLVTPDLGQRSIGEIATRARAHDGAELERVATDVIATDDELHWQFALLPPVFARAARLGALQLVAAYLDWARDQATRPVAIEEPFSRAYPGLPALSVIGQIDRLDKDGEEWRLTDYKTGKFPSDYTRSVRLGWYIQATLYPWLCDRSGATFEYVFLRDDVRPGQTAGAPPAETLLAELAPALTTGFFPPTSNQVMAQLGVDKVHPCRYCGMASACRRFERGAAPRHAALFREHFPARTQAILRAEGVTPENLPAPAAAEPPP